MQKNVDIGAIKPNSVLVVAGPTASGKSALALELAMQYNGVIINADASQLYKDIPIISAAPDENDKAKVEHLLYGILEAGEKNSISDWIKLVVKAIKNVWQQGKLPIVTGGTGFYIESLINGVSPIPETKLEVKQRVAEMFKTHGGRAVFEYLQKIDEKGAKKVNPNDTTRVRRALEIFEDTGISIDEWFEKPMIKVLPEAEFTVVLLLKDLSELEDKCNRRFDIMMNDGALDEIKSLVGKGVAADMPVMKAIGVPELMSFLRDEISIDEAVKSAKLHTRQYAKRQLTWFRNRFKKLDCKQIIF
ncbi:MAG: tRNA (adenosine(37)-N6)-dimethylallyltransferase MiaA [Alphaproteobacteria bacterium]|nr:tRNA (adenosine(37)-N6)-dimethylallyltransferase MiaA [Alphaproteobacteria bacterium]